MPAVLLLVCILSLMPPAPVHAQPAVVITIQPQTTQAGLPFRLSGSLSAERQSRLSPQVEGLVANVHVDAGDHVRAGDILLELDTAVARHQLAQSEASLAQTEAQVRESQRLVKEAEQLRQQNHISQTELARRQAELQTAIASRDAAQASLRLAQTHLRQHQLIAPFAGVIKNKWTEAGEWISRGNSVLELVALQPVRLDVQVPQERFADISPTTQVSILPDALPGVELPAQITAIVPVGDANARAFLVRMVVEADQLLLPGTSASAVFRLQNQQQQLIVPRDALLRHPDGGQSVFVIRDGHAYRQMVTTGARLSDGVVIVDGLSENAEVVIRGNESLRDGQAVSSRRQ